MTFPRQWATGIGNGIPIPGSIFTALDLNLSRALDGYAGGKYAPTSVLNVAGAGLRIGDPGDDVLFSTAASKVPAAVIDFGPYSPTVTTFQLADIASIDEGFLCAVGTGANDKLATSIDDGVSWVNVSANITVPNSVPLACCASNYQYGASILSVSGVPSISVYAGGSNVGYYTTITAQFIPFTFPGSPTSIDAIHFDSHNNQFVAIGKTSSAPYIATAPIVSTGPGVAYSPPSFTQQSVPGAITGSHIGVSISQAPSGRLIASWDSQTHVAFSDDGISWTAASTAMTSGGYIVKYGNGTWVALDRNVTSLAYASTDGNIWATAVTRPNSQSIDPHSFTALHGCFVVLNVTSGQPRIWVSIDEGATWKYRYTGTAAGYVKAIQNRVHALGVGGTFRSRRLGFSDGVY